jgi:hypothetical protein
MARRMLGDLDHAPLPTLLTLRSTHAGERDA